MRTKTLYAARWSGKEGVVRLVADGNVRVDLDCGESVVCGPLEVEPIDEPIVIDRSPLGGLFELHPEDFKP